MIKVLVKYHNQNCKLEAYGNWVDLKSAETVEFKKFESKMISLGISMKLPKYFQANIVPRSGTFLKYNIIQWNHYGVIDGPNKLSTGYSGENDIWKFGAIAFQKTIVEEGDRICQFEIRPTMEAPWYVKLRWIFEKVKFVEVNSLNSIDRGGFGSTNK